MSSQPEPAKKLRIIATEEAFGTPAQFEAMRRVCDRTNEYDADLFLWRMTLSGGPVHDRLLDLENERIRIMDENGVDMHLLSLTSTGVQMLPRDEALAIARDTNDYLADVISRHPTRFAGLATVAPQAPEETAKEIERAADSLKLNGVMINSHTDDEYLSEPKYWPILEAAEALGMPIYIHPRAAAKPMGPAFYPDHLEHAIWGYMQEVGLHGLRLITGGVFDRFPRLKIVLGHMGEGLPYWFYRIDYMHNITAGWMERPKLQKRPSDYFRENFAITTSGVNWDPPLKFNLEVLGADNVMFAIDYPYQETPEAVDWIRTADISEDDREKVAHKTAERIFKINV